MRAEPLESCLDLDEDRIEAATESSASMRAMLERFAAVAAPDAGAPVLLVALARLGTRDCAWLEGELVVELTGGAEATRLTVATQLGAGFREKVFPDLTLRVPLQEFVHAVATAPHMVEPLIVRESSRGLVLTASAEVRRTSLPPPMIEIDPSCLFRLPKLTVPYAAPSGQHSIAEAQPASQGRRVTAVGLQPEAAPEVATPKKIVLRRRARPGPANG